MLLYPHLAGPNPENMLGLPPLVHDRCFVPCTAPRTYSAKARKTREKRLERNVEKSQGEKESTGGFEGINSDRQVQT